MDCRHLPSRAVTSPAAGVACNASPIRHADSAEPCCAISRIPLPCQCKTRISNAASPPTIRPLQLQENQPSGWVGFQSATWVRITAAVTPSMSYRSAGLGISSTQFTGSPKYAPDEREPRPRRWVLRRFINRFVPPFFFASLGDACPSKLALYNLGIPPSYRSSLRLSIPKETFLSPARWSTALRGLRLLCR
jgi:hypothetical protein